MTGDALADILSIASAANAQVVDTWGRTSVRITGGIDGELRRSVMAIPEIKVVGFFGASLFPLALGEHAADADELAPLIALSPNERIAAELRSAGASLNVAEALADQLLELELIFERSAWIRTREAFFRALDQNWLRPAEGMADTVFIGDHSIDMALVNDVTTPDRPLVYVPSGASADATDPEIWTALKALADAAAWVNLAHSVDRSQGLVHISLIDHEPPVRPVTPAESDGASDLFRWTTATGDPNRREALDYVLLLVGAGSSAALPSAATVKRLAERQRLALTRERAAEVQRAIADGQRDTVEALNRASADLGALVEETTKNANATIVAVLGLVAFVAQQADRLPRWLIGLATATAVAGICVVLVSRWTRIGDHQRSINLVAARLEEDPLLPSDDRDAALTAIETFGVSKRAQRARLYVVALGLGASAVALAAGSWLTWASGGSASNNDSVTTMTTTTVP